MLTNDNTLGRTLEREEQRSCSFTCLAHGVVSSAGSSLSSILLDERPVTPAASVQPLQVLDYLSGLREHPGTRDAVTLVTSATAEAQRVSRGTTESIQFRSVGRNWRTTQGHSYDVDAAYACVEPQDRVSLRLLHARLRAPRVPMLVHPKASRDVSVR